MNNVKGENVEMKFTKCEQINSYMQMVLDYDQKFTKREEFLTALKKALGENVSLVKYQGTKDVYLYKSKGVDHYLICAAVSYLGNPHPLFKKRMQLKKWYKDFYHEYKNKPNTTINLVGVYHYDGMELYCDFNLSDYIGRKLNSSSAHVYVNDIFQAMKNGMFEKVDINGNRIAVVKGIYLKDFFDGKKAENPAIKLFQKFNSQFSFDQWLRADECIKIMLDNNWYQAKGTEWAGWFLEFRVDEFIQKENCASIMLYTGNKNKSEGMLDIRTVNKALPILADYGFGEDKVRRLIADGTVDCIRIGNRSYIALEQFDWPYAEKIFARMRAPMPRESARKHAEEQVSEVIASHQGAPILKRKRVGNAR